MFAIALSLSGRRAADAFGDPSQPTTPAINLNAVTGSAQLLPLLTPAFADPVERQTAATQLYQSILARRERGESLPNVGALLDARSSGHAEADVRPVLTRGQLSALKPFAIVRTQESHSRLVLQWTAVYLASVWLIVVVWFALGIRGDYQLLAAAHLLTALGFAALLSRQDPLRDTTLFVRHVQLTAVGFACFAIVSV